MTCHFVLPFSIYSLSICAPTFTSSDWSTHVFVIGQVINVMSYASEAKAEAKSWRGRGTNLLITQC